MLVTLLGLTSHEGRDVLFESAAAADRAAQLAQAGAYDQMPTRSNKSA